MPYMMAYLETKRAMERVEYKVLEEEREREARKSKLGRRKR